jgi:hypothetical protein
VRCATCVGLAECQCLCESGAPSGDRLLRNNRRVGACCCMMSGVTVRVMEVTSNRCSRCSRCSRCHSSCCIYQAGSGDAPGSRACLTVLGLATPSQVWTRLQCGYRCGQGQRGRVPRPSSPACRGAASFTPGPHPAAQGGGGDCVGAGSNRPQDSRVGGSWVGRTSSEIGG